MRGLLSPTQGFPQSPTDPAGYYNHQPWCASSGEMGRLDQLCLPNILRSQLLVCLAGRIFIWSYHITYNFDKSRVWETNFIKELAFQSKASDSKDRILHSSMLLSCINMASPNAHFSHGGEGDVSEQEVDLSRAPQAVCAGNCLFYGWTIPDCPWMCPFWWHSCWWCFTFIWWPLFPGQGCVLQVN